MRTHPFILLALSAVPVLIWIYLLCARGGFWRVWTYCARRWDGGPLIGSVVAIVPARNEADVIGDAVASLLRQVYGGTLQVIVVDDGSTDGTGNAAVHAAMNLGAAAKLNVIRAPPPPPDWSGKVWAMSRGVLAALPLEPDYLLFTDADIVHEPDNVAALVTIAQAGPYDLASFMVRLSTDYLTERFLIPAFVFFFFKLYPPAWIQSQRSRVAGAAGGCILLRPPTLARIGGIETIRAEIIDDCALARAVKDVGDRIWLGLTRSARSTRRYGTLADIGRMIARTAFNQLNHSYWLLLATVLGLFLTYVLPPLLFFSGLFSGHMFPIVLGVAAWTLMAIGYAPMLRFYGQSSLWGLCLPAIALFYGGATIYSALQYGLGQGGQWKGRTQDRPRPI